MKLIIAGSRGLECPQLMDYCLRVKLDINPYLTTVVSGGARGPDIIGEKWASYYKIPVEIHIPDWSKGRSAGLKRNQAMAMIADAAVVFWDGKSKGSQHMYDTMLSLSKPAIMYKVDKIVGETTTKYSIEGVDYIEEISNQPPHVLN